MIHGGVDTGWTFYTPYSRPPPPPLRPVILWPVHRRVLLDHDGPQLHRHRAHPARAGHELDAHALFVWATYGTSIIQVLATPVLGLALLLVGVEHVFALGHLRSRRGGDPVLFQHLFWFYSHPAVYIMVLPAMGVISEVVGRLQPQEPFGYKMIAFSSLGHRLRRLLRLGPPHVRQRPIRHRCAAHLRRPLDAGGHLLGHQGLQLGGHHLQGRHLLQDARSFYLLRVPLLLRLRRA